MIIATSPGAGDGMTRSRRPLDGGAARRRRGAGPPLRHAGVGVAGSPTITTTAGETGPAATSRRFARQAVLDDDRARLGIVHLVLEKPAAQAGVDRHPDRAELHRGEQQADRLGAIPEQAQHAIAGPDAERGERAGERIGPRVERAERERLAILEAHERPIALLGRPAAQEVDEGPLGPGRPSDQIAAPAADGLVALHTRDWGMAGR